MVSKKENKQVNDWLNKAILGEKAGIEYLVNTYKDLAYTIAKGIVLNNEDAEEVVQDSFMKAFSSLHKFKRASKFSTWLYRIVYNTAITKIKNRKLSTVGMDQQPENEQYAVAENHGWDLLKNKERKKYVSLALNRLSKEDRVVITLYYIGEMTIAEICEILSAGKSAIKMRLLRGRTQLEEEFELLLNNETRNLL